MIRLVSFGDEKMIKSLALCCDSAYRLGVDITWPNNLVTIGAEFKEFNKEIFAAERGCGFWLWKPYIIYSSMLHCEENDILIYSDAGIKWITNVNEIISRMDQDIFLFSNGHQHIHWCKADVMQAINGRQLEVGYQQVQASVIFFKVNQTTRYFVKEWLLWCQMPGYIDDSPSKIPNHPEFAEHRHDQAILSTLAIKHGYKLHWWADHLWYESQRYKWPEDKYPSMFEHHRKRDKGMGGGKEPEWE